MWFWLLACGDKTEDTSQSKADVVVDAAEYCLPLEVNEERIIYGHVGDLNSGNEEIPTGAESIGIPNVTVTSCINGTEMTTDQDGKFALSVPDQTFVLLEVKHPDYVPARWIVGPWHDGESPEVGAVYSNTILRPEFVEFVYSEVGMQWDTSKTMVVVDVVNPTIHSDETGSDLIGAVVELSAEVGKYVVVDDVTREFKEGNVISQNSDVIMLNVEPGPFEIRVNTPDGSVCMKPDHISAKAGELLHVSLYCQ